MDGSKGHRCSGNQCDGCQVVRFNLSSTRVEAHWSRLHRIWIRLHRILCVTNIFGYLLCSPFLGWTSTSVLRPPSLRTTRYVYLSLLARLALSINSGFIALAQDERCRIHHRVCTDCCILLWGEVRDIKSSCYNDHQTLFC